jgi:type IV fimbrial biogenesis protein FimT
MKAHGNSPFARRLVAGMTLVELVVVLSIIAIVAGLAVPGMDGFRRSATRSASVNDYMHSIFLARNKSIMLNRVVSLCRSADGETCGGAGMGWERGWIVFENLDRDQPADRDRNEPIVQRHGGWPGMSITSNRASFSFRPITQGDVNGTIIFCDLQGKNADARAIVISHLGRPRVSRKDGSNKAIRCG